MFIRCSKCSPQIAAPTRRCRGPRPRGSKPLALNEGVRPGDRAFCLSNPKELQGFFSLGHVSRFYRQRADAKKPGCSVFLHVTTDWAAGSSRAAVLDEYGKGIGRVASTRTLLWRDEKQQATEV